ncbi:uncharacterized protein Z519_06916 [Cladophialophora bantiana CBS 173.52]|uniref:Xylanolytic transcriptional activator regulatory domain-containing protein n=1 Tax=Cladophialophora bantiana (strain ATCC 10958 / CBS 173.52 / CDC B-1940 / NIH 8579) TaxID=1442370 RepID=A0A0D2ET57_CLAB1|nr:uncharacterized protein Z519_06916 [Cladophialophora bantiana CBS 173.52]KIW93066.1 hypothetical protein Z519_06916 [Cladophialophora bantiana CBS 173.52]
MRIEEFQRMLKANNDQQSLATPPQESVLEATVESRLAPTHTPGISLLVYERFLEVFRLRLYSVWPVVSYGELIAALRNNQEDYESYSLAAALCAAVIAQLRLPEHVVSFNCVSSSEMVAESQKLRQLFEYQENYSMTSLLTSFFLHIYFANADKLRTAGFHLRETLTYAHGLKLHLLDDYADMNFREHQLRLRVYWILFVSERTYCVQNGLPTTLRPINEFPSTDPIEGYDGAPLPAFIALIRLFTFLDGDILWPIPSSAAVSIQGAPKNQISVLQHDLTRHPLSEELDESQRVDILATRNWIRILLWQYTITHFPVSCHAHDQAFSALLPATIAHDMLSVLENVSWKSIQPHGYGMELKIFRIADCLLDVLLCAPTSAVMRGLLMESRQSLHLLEKVLADVGGTGSHFFSTLQQRMVESQLPVPHTLQNDLQISWYPKADEKRKSTNATSDISNGLSGHTE